MRIVIYCFSNSISFDLFVVFNDLIKFRKLALLILSKLFHNQSLCIDSVRHLLLELFNWCLHPMSVIKCWLNILLFKLKFDLWPNFTNFEMRVHLNDFHLLLLVSVQIIFIESNSVQNAENYESNIVLLDFFFDSVDQICFHSCLS